MVYIVLELWQVLRQLQGWPHMKQITEMLLETDTWKTWFSFGQLKLQEKEDENQKEKKIKQNQGQVLPLTDFEAGCWVHKGSPHSPLW